MRLQPTAGPGRNRPGTVPELHSGTKGVQNDHLDHPTYQGTLLFCGAYVPTLPHTPYPAGFRNVLGDSMQIKMPTSNLYIFTFHKVHPSKNHAQQARTLTVHPSLNMSSGKSTCKINFCFFVDAGSRSQKIKRLSAASKETDPIPICESANDKFSHRQTQFSV